MRGRDINESKAELQGANNGQHCQQTPESHPVHKFSGNFKVSACPQLKERLFNINSKRKLALTGFSDPTVVRATLVALQSANKVGLFHWLLNISLDLITLFKKRTTETIL